MHVRAGGDRNPRFEGLLPPGSVGDPDDCHDIATCPHRNRRETLERARIEPLEMELLGSHVPVHAHDRRMRRRRHADTKQPALTGPRGAPCDFGLHQDDCRHVLGGRATPRGSEEKRYTANT